MEVYRVWKYIYRVWKLLLVAVGKYFEINFKKVNFEATFAVYDIS